ncbi:hypothetical protein ACIRVF_15555 [Kitasatospora sp. NPDC101157]|uniref:hypothetical protein n=1 Tax=Kitasatospora sp. NPDC101157 TaxID=3364098 RepID=UPI003805E56B
MTRTALVADLHGRYQNLRRIIDAAAAARADRIVVVGDYLEAKVSKKLAAAGGHWSLEEVVDPDPPLWESLLSDCVLVRGNQEERIAHLLAGQPLPPALAGILAAPPEYRDKDAVYVHGHGFDWYRTEQGPWCPVLREPGAPHSRYFFGHSHRRILVETGGTDGSTFRRLTEPATGSPHVLGQGGPWLVNCGAAFQDAAHWTLYDDDDETVTFMTAGDS